MRRMTYPLTEKQKEIVDYADSHSYKETEEKFGIGHNQVKYLKGRGTESRGRRKPLRAEAFSLPWPSPGSNAPREISRGENRRNCDVAFRLRSRGGDQETMIDLGENRRDLSLSGDHGHEEGNRLPCGACLDYDGEEGHASQALRLLRKGQKDA